MPLRNIFLIVMILMLNLIVLVDIDLMDHISNHKVTTSASSWSISSLWDRRILPLMCHMHLYNLLVSWMIYLDIEEHEIKDMKRNHILGHHTSSRTYGMNQTKPIICLCMKYYIGIWVVSFLKIVLNIQKHPHIVDILSISLLWLMAPNDWFSLVQ